MGCPVGLLLSPLSESARDPLLVHKGQRGGHGHSPPSSSTCSPPSPSPTVGLSQCPGHLLRRTQARPATSPGPHLDLRSFRRSCLFQGKATGTSWVLRASASAPWAAAPAPEQHSCPMGQNIRGLVSHWLVSPGTCSPGAGPHSRSYGLKSSNAVIRIPTLLHTAWSQASILTSRCHGFLVYKMGITVHLPHRVVPSLTMC